MSDLHACSGQLPHAACGAALSACETREDGFMLVGNGEYTSRVNFCPYCGEPAPKRVRRVFINERIAAEMLAQHRWEVDVGEVVWGDESIADDVALVAAANRIAT